MLNTIRIVSWCLFDFASTAFMMNIVSLCFVQWIDQNFGNGDTSFGLISAFLYGLCIILYPISGEICDRGWKLLPLASLTFLSILGTALVGFTNSLALGALSFILAYLTYQIALTYYNALLADIATPEKQGIVSGLGIATRYCGAIFGLVSVNFFIHGGGQKLLPTFLAPLVIKPAQESQTIYANGFLPTAVIYFLFALPLFLFVRSTKQPLKAAQASFGEILKSTLSNLKEVLRTKNALWLLLTISLGGAPLYAVVHFMTVFLKKVGNVPDQDLTKFLVVSTVFSVFGGLGFGFSLRAVGNKRIFNAVILIWVAVLMVGTFAQGQTIMWYLGAFAGIGMGGYWAVARILILDITPEGKQGEYMSLFGIVMVVCGILGTLLWPFGVKIAQIFALPFTPQRLSTCILAVVGITAIFTFLPVKFPEKSKKE